LRNGRRLVAASLTMPPARVLFWLMTIAALFVSFQAILGSPPSLTFVAIFSSIYAVLFMCGIFILRLRIFVDVMIQGPRGAKGVALTFDDGPDPESTTRTLDALDAAGVKATFFVIGKKVEAHPEVVRSILDRGHAIGLHSYAHDRLFAMRGAARWIEDLKRCTRVVEDITGQRVRIFRPPIGHTVPHTPRVIRKLGLRVIGWNVSARDGIRANPKNVTSRILENANDGSIILLHDASERGTHPPAGVAALPEILEGLKKRGLAIVPLSDWM
jgi:peptidoglycan-N-acetylglucosamine deacetylase